MNHTETAAPGAIASSRRAGAAPPNIVASRARRAPRGTRPWGTWRIAVGWLGAVFGAIVILACLSVCATLIWDLTQAGTDVPATLIGIAVAAVAGVALGMLPMWFAARAVAKIAFSILALVLVTGGLALLTAAPVVRQMNTPELIEYRGFWMLTWFGLLTTLLGVALAALCVRWSVQKHARRVLARWSRLLGAGTGVLLSLWGLNLLFGFVSLIGGEATFDETSGEEFTVVEQALLFTAIVAFTLVPGITLTYHGISASMGEGSGEFRAPIFWIGVWAFAVVLLAGQANMAAESPSAAPMPPLHVLAAVIPGITLAALAARGSPWRGEPVRGLSWRQVTLAAAISMTVAVAIAVYVETIGALYAVIWLLVHNGAFEFAANTDEVFEIIGDATLYLSDNEQFVAGLITAAVLAPVSEEFGKSLGVRFLMRPHTTRAQCFVLGAFAGAGFGFLEALLYGIAGVADDADFWWAIMLIRGGSTSLHVLCTGLAGVGWWYWSRAKRHGLALSLFGAAMLIHGLWNAFATLLDSRIFFFDTLSNRATEIIAYSVVAIVSAAMIAAIPLIARRLREPIAPVEGTPLAAMQPWLA